MRIRTLHLTRYGKFTDRQLDFGPASPGKPDFHLVYGPNEAGKSTLLSAWLDLMFGIPARSTYAFLHPYETMRIGAELDFEQATRTLWRIKRPANSLLDDNDLPLGDSWLMAEAGGLDRAGYCTMFSLDDETIEKGGEDILASRGDLGQLLFSASAGLSDLSSQLKAIGEKADQFHKPRGRSTALSGLKERLDHLKAERDRIDVLASRHAAMVTDLEKAAKAFDEANGKRGAKRAQLEALQRQLGLLPRLAHWQDVQARLAGLGTIPDAPGDWTASVQALRSTVSRLSGLMERINRDKAEIDRQLNEIASDGAMLSASGSMVELDGLSARAITARRDLSNRQDELKSAEAAIRLRLARLGRAGESDPWRLVVDAPTTGRLRRLLADHGAMRVSLTQARKEVQTARDSLTEAENRQAGEGRSGLSVEPAFVVTLSALLAEHRSADLADRLERARRALADAEAATDQHLAQLMPWTGSAEDLCHLILPDRGQLADWTMRLKAAQDAVEKNRDNVERLDGERAMLEAERNALAGRPGLVDDAAISASRQRRDAAWALHRASLDGASADGFAAAMAADDLLQASLLAQATDAARLRDLDQTLALRREALHQARQALSRSEAALLETRNDFAGFVLTLSGRLDPAIEPASLERWLGRAERAREAADLLATRRRDLAEQQAAIRRLCETFTRHLAAVGMTGLDDELEALASQAAKLVEAADRQENARRLLAERRGEVRTREIALAKADEAMTEWQAGWQSALAGTWLAGTGAGTTPEIAGDILVDLAELAAELAARDGLADRIGKMERDIADFGHGVARLWRTLETAPMPDDPAIAWRKLQERQMLARDGDMARSGLLARRNTLAEEHRATSDGLDAAQAEIATMERHFGVSGLDEIAACLARLAERQRLVADLDQVSAELRQGTATSGIEAATSLLAGLDRMTIEASIAALRPECDGLDSLCQTLFAARTQAEDQLAALSGDNAVAKIEEERRTILLDIEEGAKTWIKLRLGSLATEQALRLYREQHRSAMMSRASAAFAEITCGRYSGLASQADGMTEELIARQADGASKRADNLSKGTRFQLYLALRVAGYHDLATNRRPVPFIADDIMETFDDERAAATFGLFAGMAEKGQVIYLTHHHHLMELARRTVPGATIHTL